MATFAELGIPFPLFEADASEATDYRGLGVCIVCTAQDVHCFKPSAVPVICPSCYAENWLEVPHHEPPMVEGLCSACHTRLPGGLGLACYACLRAGRVTLGKDTQLGLVGREQAESGLTHGLPGLNHPDFEMVPLPKPSAENEWVRLVPWEYEQEWVQARVPSEYLYELIGTPTYSTWQGEKWLFCCGAPMIYIGAWTPETFTLQSLDGDGRAFFNRVMTLDDEYADQLWRGGYASFYVFRCQRCANLRAHFDYI